MEGRERGEGTRAWGGDAGGWARGGRPRGDPRKIAEAKFYPNFGRAGLAGGGRKGGRGWARGGRPREHFLLNFGRAI